MESHISTSVVGTDMSTGAAWASTVLIKGQEDLYIVSSILLWLSELGHSKVIIQTVSQRQTCVAMMENPPCEIVQQQSERYSPGATEEQNEWYKPYAIRSKPARFKLRRTQESPSKSTVLCSLGYIDTQHGNTRDSTNDKTQQPQHTRDSTHVLPKPNRARWRGSCVQTTRSTGQQTGISMARSRAWLGRDST